MTVIQILIIAHGLRHVKDWRRASISPLFHWALYSNEIMPEMALGLKKSTVLGSLSGSISRIYDS